MRRNQGHEKQHWGSEVSNIFTLHTHTKKKTLWQEFSSASLLVSGMLTLVLHLLASPPQLLTPTGPPVGPKLAVKYLIDLLEHKGQSLSTDPLRFASPEFPWQALPIGSLTGFKSMYHVVCQVIFFNTGSTETDKHRIYRDSENTGCLPFSLKHLHQSISGVSNWAIVQSDCPASPHRTRCAEKRAEVWK